MDTIETGNRLDNTVQTSLGHLSIAQKYPRTYNSKTGFFTIPYGFKATPLSSYDFTIDQRDKIYLKENDKSDTPVAILFYDEYYLTEDNTLDIVQKMFLDVSGKVGTVIFRFCNLSIETVLAEEFKRIREDKTHPFNTIISSSSKSNTNIFVLVYKKGYPQCKYEGPVNTKSFENFIINFTSDVKYFEDIKRNPNEVKNQIWIEYNNFDLKEKSNFPKKVIESFSESPALLRAIESKPIPIPRNRMSETLGGFTTNKSTGKVNDTIEWVKSSDNKYKVENIFGEIWTNKLRMYGYKFDDKIKNDKNTIRPLDNIGVSKENLISKLLTSMFKSTYREFFIPQIKKKQDNRGNTGGGGGEDAVIKNNSSIIYEILSRLQPYTNTAVNIFKSPTDTIEAAVNLYGFYLYKLDDRIPITTQNDLSGLYRLEGFNPLISSVAADYIFVKDKSIISYIVENVNKALVIYNKRDDVNKDEEIDLIDNTEATAIKEIIENNVNIKLNYTGENFPMIYWYKDNDGYFNEDTDEKTDLDEDLQDFLDNNFNLRKSIYNFYSNPQKK
jgi:hypothetical protein